MSYFSESEQACPCCGKINLASHFLDDLNHLRSLVGHPMKVNSMCRCDKHNSSVGGAVGSYHRLESVTGCCAADISTINWGSTKKWKFVKIALSLGFSVGIAKTFIHIDQRMKYAAKDPVLYTY